MNPTQERWLPVSGYEGYYEVSDHGHVRSLDRRGSDGRKVTGRLLAPGRHHRDKHRQVNLSKGGKARTVLVHRLVLEAFVGPPPEGQEACHWDDDPDNNHLSNLRWATSIDNFRDRIRNGRSIRDTQTHCIRGHRLADPNLAPDNRRQRRCLACTRAHTYLLAHGHPMEAMETVAKHFYREIEATGKLARKRRGREWLHSLADPPQHVDSAGDISNSALA